MPIWLTLERQQLEDLAKEAIRGVRDCLEIWEEKWMDDNNIAFDLTEREMLYKIIAEMLTGEYKHGTNNTKQSST